MSWLDALLAGWGFRTATPEFESGDVVTAFVTGSNSDGVVVRIGDTIIHVPDADSDLVEAKVELEITSFDASADEGTGKIVAVLGREE